MNASVVTNAHTGTVPASGNQDKVGRTPVYMPLLGICRTEINTEMMTNISSIILRLYNYNFPVHYVYFVQTGLPK